MAETLDLSGIPHEIASNIQKEAKPQKIGGCGYGLMLGVTLIKDLLIDFLEGILTAVGVALSATVIGAAVGIPLIVLVKYFQIMIGAAVWGLIYVYLFLQDGTHLGAQAERFIVKSSIRRLARSKFARRLFIGATTFFLGTVPGINFLPETTLGFILLIFLENRIRQSDAIRAAIAKAQEFRALFHGLRGKHAEMRRMIKELKQISQYE